MKSDNNNKPQNSTDKQVITRKQALKKAGLVTLTTASMMLLMKTPAKAATSQPTAPPSNW